MQSWGADGAQQPRHTIGKSPGELTKEQPTPETLPVTSLGRGAEHLSQSSQKERTAVPR